MKILITRVYINNCWIYRIHDITIAFNHDNTINLSRSNVKAITQDANVEIKNACNVIDVDPNILGYICSVHLMHLN
jgi:hypothetical protein